MASSVSCALYRKYIEAKKRNEELSALYVTENEYIALLEETQDICNFRLEHNEPPEFMGIKLRIIKDARYAP